MNLTRRTNNAIRILTYCALRGSEVSSLGSIAAGCNASEHHLAKVAALLAERGWIETVRGRLGGVRLAKAAAEINLGDVVAATENFDCVVECFDAERNTCPLAEHCRFPSVIRSAFAAFHEVLAQHTLAELVADPAALRPLVGLDAIAAE